VLDRVPPGCAKDILPDLGAMLTANDLDGTPVFMLPEVRLDGQGLLSEPQVAPLQDWFARLAASTTARTSVVRHTVEGAIISSGSAVSLLAAAAEEQVHAVRELHAAVSMAYHTAQSTVELGMRDGSLLQGEVTPRWRRLAETRTRRPSIEFVRDRMAAGLSRRAEADERLLDAIEAGLVALVRAAAANAAEQAANAWRLHPAGAALLETGYAEPGDLFFPAPHFAAAAGRLISDWRQQVLASAAGRSGALRVMIGTCAESGEGDPPGGTQSITGPGKAPSEHLQVTPAESARRDLLDQIGPLLDAEAARFRALLDRVGVDPALAEQLRRAAAAVEAAHQETHPESSAQVAAGELSETD
jgi:hypothetical protein